MQLIDLQQSIEALIFCSPQAIKREEIKDCLEEITQNGIEIELIEQEIEHIKQKYASPDFAIQVYEIGGGWQFLTKPDYKNAVSVLLKQKSKKRLSTAAMETLAIIAYKQPISKGQIEQIRGVNCDYAVHKLLERELIEIRGKAETIGRPMLYGTTPKFMDYLGINKLQDLPSPKDFVKEENSIGEAVS
jgi:segregation and condensation protein B